MMWGRLLGTIFGYLIFRFPGALLGFFLGYLVDKALKRHRLASLSPEEREKIQSSFLEAIFTALGFLAKCDGRVSEKEIQVTEAIMAHLNLDSSDRQEAMERFRRGKILTQDSMGVLLEQFHAVVKDFPSVYSLFLQFQFQLAFADGEPSTHEVQVLRFYAQKLGLGRFQFDQFYRMYQAHYFFHHEYQSQGYSRQNHQNTASFRADTLTHAYGVLGLSKGASLEEVKKSYRKLMNEYHPDKLASKGLPESMMKAATEKAQEIGQAYELILKHLGKR